MNKRRILGENKRQSYCCECGEQTECHLMFKEDVSWETARFIAISTGDRDELFILHPKCINLKHGYYETVKSSESWVIARQVQKE